MCSRHSFEFRTPTSSAILRMVTESTRIPSNKSGAVMSENRHCITPNWHEPTKHKRARTWGSTGHNTHLYKCKIVHLCIDMHDLIKGLRLVMASLDWHESSVFIFLKWVAMTHQHFMPFEKILRISLLHMVLRLQCIEFRYAPAVTLHLDRLIYI